MKLVYLSILLLLTPIMAYAEPLEDMSAVIINVKGDMADVKFTWNHDGDVKFYEVGCVSCQPNLKDTTIHDHIILSNIQINDGTILLYVVAYDEDEFTIEAKQVLLRLE